MSTKADETVEKVTSKLEKGDDELLRLLRRMVTQANGAVDPDLEQDVFVRVLQAFRRRSDIRHPRALMRKIAHDTVVDAWRVRMKGHPCAIEPLPDLTMSTTPRIEDEIDKWRTISLLRESIFELGCDIRGPVYLFYVEQYPIDTIVQVFGKSQSAVKMALYRGRQQLSSKLKAEAAHREPISAFP